MNTELDNKYKQYIRLLISYNDFKQAADIAHVIQEEKYLEKRKTLRGADGQKVRIIWEGLNCAMIVAYCRPFSGNDKKEDNKIPDLPKNILKCLTKEEKEIHNVVFEERDKIMAHSDSGAWRMNPFYLKLGDKGTKIVIPKSDDVRAPLLPGPVMIINGICRKLMDEIFQLRLALENEIGDYLPTQVLTDIEIEDLNKKFKFK